jgi:hypothetical protein
LAGSNVVESAILMEFAAAPYAPKHGPGNTHHNTVTTPNTLNSRKNLHEERRHLELPGARAQLTRTS